MAPDAPNPIILELEGVVAGYGAMTILNETTLAVARGRITTIIGPNGAGKSTVFKTIFGMLPARRGQIRFDGHDITNVSPRKLLDLGICYVPQGRNLFPELSVYHNLELGGVASSKQAGLKSRIEEAMARFPVLARKAKAQASTLSGGEQKLLEIARGLLLEPKLMLVDEPSIGLSPLMVQETFGILKGLRASGVSVLMVEQNAKSALEISDFGIVLELGRTRMQEPAQSLLNNPKVGQLFLGGAIESAA